MHCRYSDIRSRIDEDPSWFTEEGVPRYGDFRPDALGVYDKYAALFAVPCQACGVRLMVGVGRPRYYITPDFEVEPWSLPELVDGWSMGDPPRHDCVGDTMTHEEPEVVGKWEMVDFEWEPMR